jgi:hypothetical protein
MIFTLENIHINPTKNLFFHQTGIATKEQSFEHINPIVQKHIKQGSWCGESGWYLKTMQSSPLPNGSWKLITIIPNFVSIASAIEFFKDSIADGTEFRRLKRAWHQDNGILNETNVLDENGNIVEVVHACQAHKCLRFGTCPSEDSGCATVPEHTHDGIYPIYHINAI